MSAIRKIQMIEAAAPKSAARLAEVITIARPAAPQQMGVAKRVALFIASPFVGLAYIAAMPFVAAAVLAWFAAKALAARTPASVKKAGMILAAPFLGLGFIIALPMAGITAIGYYAIRAKEQA